MPTAAKSGASATRAFHHAAKLPWGSVSTTATGPAPARSASTAKCAARVVFPVPPFCDAMVRTRIDALPYVRVYVREKTQQCGSIAERTCVITQKSPMVDILTPPYGPVEKQTLLWRQPHHPPQLHSG